MPAVPSAVPWLLGALAQPEPFAALVKKLVTAGTLDRIQKICMIIPESTLGPAMAAANMAAMVLQRKDPKPSEDEIRASMRAAYEPAFDAAVRPLFDGRWMAAVAFVAGVAAIAIAMTMDPPIHVAAVMGALAVVAVAMNARAASKIIASAHFLDGVLPTYVDAIRNRISTAPAYADDESDPRAWAGRLDSILYGFDERSPDLFFEIVVLPFARELGALRVAKVRRSAGAHPRYVVAVFGETEALRRFRDEVEKKAPSRYASCTTPAAEIAPDASYGPETRTRTDVLDELRRGTLDVVATA